MTTKLFERLVTKFSIKVNDLAKYLEISKATIYNYRNLDDFHKNSLQDANSIILKYVELTINDLSNLSMDNISKNYFFKNYYDK